MGGGEGHQEMYFLYTKHSPVDVWDERKALDGIHKLSSSIIYRTFWLNTMEAQKR